MFANRAVTAVSLLGGVLAIIISLVYANPILPIVAAVFFCMTLLIWKYGYLIIPVFTRATNVVEVHGDGYEVPPTRDYIIKKNESGYYASKFLEVKFYESSMDKNADEKR